MSSVAVKPPRITPLSWSRTHDLLNAHGASLRQLHAHDHALKEAMAGKIINGRLESPVKAVMTAGFWGRLKWFITGRVS